MSLRKLGSALASTALAIAMSASSAVVASANTPNSASASCRLAADVVLTSVDGRVHGVGTVTCPRPVDHTTVAVTLTRDDLVVARDKMTCSGQASCRADAAAPNLPGTQLWCARATGSNASGWNVDPVSAKKCEKG